MAETLASRLPHATAEMFDHGSDEHVSAVIAMYGDYLLEELNRIGHHAPGIPVANWLKTAIFCVGDTPAGFIAVDNRRRSVELVYITPEFRGHGLASQALADLSYSCPQPMKLKTPLSPGGQALTDRLGLGLARSSDEELRKAQSFLDELHRNINRRCPHKRTGDPRRPCKRCYRGALKRSAATAVMSYVVPARAAAALNVV